MIEANQEKKMKSTHINLSLLHLKFKIQVKLLKQK